MKSHSTLIRMNIVLAGLLAAALAAASPAGGTFYPNEGDFAYSGDDYADGYLSFTSPGPWQWDDSGYEHDLSVEASYFDECWTWTDLPNAYDDCATAGVSEPEERKVFSFGSYHAENIQPHYWYFGTWSFSGGYGASTDFGLFGQETRHDFCPFDSVWCMRGMETEPLLSGELHWGTESGWNWWR